MRRFLHRIGAEVARTWKKPSRLAGVGSGRKLAGWFRWLLVGDEFIAGPDWVRQEATNFIVRAYGDYEDYIAHQQSKLSMIDLSEYDKVYRALLRERLEQDGLRAGDTVLCLGARLGTEVKSFIDKGCFAIGIDLNPGEDNHFVVKGDFHAVQYAAASVDVAFSNALDHALMIEKVLGEVRRVLKKDGKFIVEASKGTEEGHGPANYESLYWSKIDDLIAIVERAGFTFQRRFSFDDPWPGEHLLFTASQEGAAGEAASATSLTPPAREAVEPAER